MAYFWCSKRTLLILAAILFLAGGEILGEDICVKQVYDFIVVGTGSAGGVLLSRLSENPKVKVLALEAGGVPTEESEIPFLTDFNIMGPLDWNYTTVFQPSCCRMYQDQVVLYGRGKALGGSSSINFMAYTRGNKYDFDNWNIDGWDYDSVLPYFKKFEDYQAPYTRHDEKYHSKGGPITIEVPEYKTPLAQAYKAALMEMGYYETDFNAEFQEGYMDAPANTRNHSRCGTYKGYIRPAMGRPNLRVETNALVTKILFHEKYPKMAIGVEYEKNGKVCQARAKKEVILSGGSVNSPQLLMLSGIGPKEHLEEKGIQVVCDVPGVGQNLHDHVDLVLAFPIVPNISMNYYRVMADKNNHVLYENFRTGPLTVSVGNEVTAFVKSKLNPHKDLDWPDLELYFTSDHVIRPLAKYLHPEIQATMPSHETDYFTIAITIHHPESRGSITLNSCDPHDQPNIDPQFLAQGNDLKVLAEGAKIAFHVVEQEALKRYGARIPEEMSPFCNAKEMGEQEYFDCLAETWSTTSWHPVGTCKMGTDKMAVVDSKLRVHGIKNLRIADASIIPITITGHTNAVSIMIGEKAADIIKTDHNIE